MAMGMLHCLYATYKISINNFVVIFKKICCTYSKLMFVNKHLITNSTMCNSSESCKLNKILTNYPNSTTFEGRHGVKSLSSVCFFYKHLTCAQDNISSKYTIDT